MCAPQIIVQVVMNTYTVFVCLNCHLGNRPPVVQTLDKTRSIFPVKTIFGKALTLNVGAIFFDPGIQYENIR